MRRHIMPSHKWGQFILEIFLIHFLDFIKKFLKFLYNWLRGDDFRPSAKTANPPEELIAHFHIGGHIKMVIVHLFINNAAPPKAVNDCIKQFFCNKPHFNTRSFPCTWKRCAA